jgi:hypothetical protein
MEKRKPTRADHEARLREMLRNAAVTRDLAEKKLVAIERRKHENG